MAKHKTHMAVLAPGEVCAARLQLLAGKNFHKPCYFINGRRDDAGRFEGTKVPYSCSRAVCGEQSPNLITHRWESATCKRCSALRNATAEELADIRKRGKRSSKVAEGPPDEKKVPLHPQTSLFAELKEVNTFKNSWGTPWGEPAACDANSPSIFHRKKSTP